MATFIEPTDEPIRITARGEWRHGSEPITRKVADLFSRHLVVRDDGSYAIKLGKQTQKIEVEDAPFVVKSIQDDAATPQHLILQTSDGHKETLDPATLMQSTDNVLYCRVKRDGFMVPCRFAPSQYHALALEAEQEGDTFFLPLGGQRYAIGPYDHRPKKLN